MSQLNEKLQNIQNGLIGFLAKADKTAESKQNRRQAKSQIKSIIKNLAMRMGSDLLLKPSFDMNDEEKKWVCEQAKQAITILCAKESPLAEEAKDYLYVMLNNEIIVKHGGIIPVSDWGELSQCSTRVNQRKTNQEKFNWKDLASTGFLVVHAGFLAYSATSTITATGFMGFWSSVFASIGTGAVWLATQTREILAKISLAESIALPILKIVGITLYAVLMAPLILRTIYKNLRNIFALNKYAEKRFDSIKRLLSSLLFAGAGIALGVVAGTLGWGGGPWVALGLAALGWVVGHSLYKFYKRRRDRIAYFGTSNPQKWFLTHAQMKRVLAKSESVSADTFNPNVVMNNLMYLVARLAQTAQQQKEERRRERSWIFALSYRLWGLDFSTEKRRAAEKAIHHLKLGNWQRAQAYCGSSYLNWGLDLCDFSTHQNRPAATSTPLNPLLPASVPAPAVADGSLPSSIPSVMAGRGTGLFAVPRGTAVVADTGAEGDPTAPGEDFGAQKERPLPSAPPFGGLTPA